jgi:putative DNA primase/helicase
LAQSRATRSYLADEDALGLFLTDRCATGTADEMVEVRDLFSSWKEWAEAAGEFVGSDKRFSQQMDGRGYQRCHQPVTRRACFQGIRLMVAATPDVGG